MVEFSGLYFLLENRLKLLISYHKVAIFINLIKRLIVSALLVVKKKKKKQVCRKSVENHPFNDVLFIQ